MSQVTITVDSVTYYVPESGGKPLSRFALPDGRVIRVTRWQESMPPKIKTFEIEAAPALPVAQPSLPARSAETSGGFFVAKWDTGSGLLMFLRSGFTGSGFSVERAWRFGNSAAAEDAAAKIDGRVVDASAVEAAAFRACEAHLVLG